MTIARGGPSGAPSDGPSGGAGRRMYSVVVFIVLASLDNVAIGLVPPLYQPIAHSLGVGESAVGLATAVTYLISAVAAVAWAYIGDRTNRKPVLMAGTLLWAAGTAATALSSGYPMFLLASVVGSVGLGAVGSVGFSVVSDLISPRRRGLVMSLFGLSQGVGMLVGTLLGGLLGAADWRRPFWVITIVGVAATIAYRFTLDIRRGESEPELAALYRAGGEYTPRIGRADLPRILARRTNIWLILQGVTAQITFGSLVWLPRLFQERAQAQGYSMPTAIAIGSLYATLFQFGGVLSIVGGIAGDRLQRRTPRGRALVAAAGILAGIPLYVVLFFVPLRVHVVDGAGAGAVTTAVLGSLFTEPTVTISFLTAILALGLTSANAPNWFAMIADVNLPEHRGSVYSLGNLANGTGRAVGNALVGVAFRGLAGRYPPPLNFAVGLAAFQLFFVPTGIMYYLASRTVTGDIATVGSVLRDRAAAGPVQSEQQ